MKKRKLILVDNDRALLRSIELSLSNGRFDIDTYSDPVEALDQIRGGDPPYALIIDYVMPRMNGDIFLKKLKPSLSENCRVIIISGHTDSLEDMDLDEIGVHGFLPKPLDIGKLKELIGRNG